MAGCQRTFELIPTSLVKSNGPKPPMTSKAAKKAHLLATRGPKVSRAEQRRRDTEELARQKKEYEREKAYAKAKVTREKRAAKEEADREMRRKKNIPDPSKFVRASQPTISMFVKNGTKRAWLEIDPIAEDSDTTTVCEEEAEQGVRPVGPHAKEIKAGEESEDEYGCFPSFSQSELGMVLEQVESSAQLQNNQKDQTEHSLTATPDSLDCKQKESPKIAAKIPTTVGAMKKRLDDTLFPDSDSIDDMAATQLLSEAADAVARFRRQVELPKPKSQLSSMPSKSGIMSKSTPPISTNQQQDPSPKTTEASRPVLQERSINIPSPVLTVPTKEKRSISFAPSPLKPRTLTRLQTQQISRSPALPPSATQAFLEDHLDDFFPSPSQEIRELLDIDYLPTNTQIARELESNEPSNAPQKDCLAEFFCTQDFVLSSQDILEITTTPCPPSSKPKTAEQPASTPTPLPAEPMRQPRRRFFEEKDEDLLHAAIQESKMFAVLKEDKCGERSPLEGCVKPRR